MYLLICPRNLCQCLHGIIQIVVAHVPAIAAVAPLAAVVLVVTLLAVAVAVAVAVVVVLHTPLHAVRAEGGMMTNPMRNVHRIIPAASTVKIFCLLPHF